MLRAKKEVDVEGNVLVRKDGAEETANSTTDNDRGKKNGLVNGGTKEDD